MIFHRLSVSRYKGIRSADIHFAPAGITLIEGRNEIGKSSLVQAITTLFDEPISRTRAKLGHLIPKDGSGFPDITLEGTTGAYRFSFRKRFIENKTVELRLTAPEEEFLSGKEAQERFEEILHATLDRTLWRALMLQQGAAVGLPEVEDQQALMSALDSAVSGPGAARDGENLYAAVAEEYGKYYHAGHGGELQTLRSLREKLDAAEKAVESGEEQARELERKIARARQLRQHIRDLAERETVERESLRKNSEQLAEVERFERLAEDEQNRYARAMETRAAAGREHDARRRLVLSAGAADEKLLRLAEDARRAATAEAEAAAAAEGAASVMARLGAERERLESLARLRRSDYEYYRDMLELERLKERHERFLAALARVRGAERELARNAMTEDAARDIAEAGTAVAVARARFESAAPRLELEAIGECAVVVDGVEMRLAAGDVRDVAVTEAATLDIPGVVRARVTAGGSGLDLARSLDEAKRRLASLLATHGLPDAAGVHALLEARRAAARVLADDAAVSREEDGDADARRIQELEASLPGYLPARPDGPALPGSSDEARRERDRAEEELDGALARMSEAEAAWSVAEDARLAARDGRVRLEAERGGAERETETVRRLLAESREKNADAGLESALAAAEGDAEAAAAALAGVRAGLRELGADLVRSRAELLDAAVKRTMSERSAAREELARLDGVLEQLGGSGLDERLSAARAERDHGAKVLAAAVRKAEAAGLLYRVLTEARERSGRSYVRPLRERIEDLARSVYGTGVRVTLGPDLRITGRTMHGMDIAFGELSGGAREQFSLIHRAACSLAVAEGGGVPLILDDALGYSDNERLLGMNEVLMRAGGACQIIILTCMPGRYAYLRPAARVNLEEIFSAAPGVSPS